MDRRLAAALGVVSLALAGAGCARDETAPVTATPAPPQRAAVDWVEPAPAESPALVFEVEELEVTEDGWRARVAMRNRSSVTWDLDRLEPLRYGVMLFATGEMGELEQRNANQDLPGLRPARRFEPPLPSRLEPGASWEATLSAPGALAAGRWLRVAFGPLSAEGDAPEGLPAQLVWITDNAYRLRG